MIRASYGKQELQDAFKKIGEQIPAPITVFLFGGGAMAFRNQKTATKDLDLVFENYGDYEKFTDALEKIRFFQAKSFEKEYEKMHASSIWQNKQGFRLDLFVKTICNALDLTATVINRAETFLSFNNLAVKMFSNEDIVLFKGITERPADADDVAVIIKTSNINWDLILGECILQSKKRAWHGALLNKLYEIKEKHGITAPITKQLQRLYERTELLIWYREKLNDGKTHEQIIQELKKRVFTKKDLTQLEEDIKNQ